MSKIFITGGGGFLGSFLVSALKEIGCVCVTPSSSQCNLLFENSLDQFSDLKYDYVLHLAAWTQAGDFCLRHPADQWIKNQKINTNVLSWWFNQQSQAKLIFMGTSCSYAEESSFKEQDYMTGDPVESLYTYAMTKRMLLQGARALESQYGMNWLCLVPSTLYGPNYHTDGRQMHFIFDLVRKILRGKHFGEEVELWGDGSQRRELIHVNDFVKAFLKLYANLNNEVVNIGGGADFEITDFAKIICNKVGYSHDHIKYNTSKYVGARSKLLNVSKLSELIPGFYDTTTQVEDGIEELCVWFEKNSVY